MDTLQLVEKITTNDLWPGFKDADRLEELDKLADEAFMRGTFDGYLASVLITHQICDELIRLLISNARFTIQLMVVPNGFGIKFGSKEDDSDLEKLMTGQLIAALDKSLEFEEKDEFLSLCKEMAEIRNKLAHQLARKVNLDDIRGTTEKYRTKFARAKKLFFQADDVFRLFYKDSRKDDSWDFLLEEMLEDAELDLADKCKRIIKLREEAGFGVA